jgi:hypothetical protein
MVTVGGMIAPAASVVKPIGAMTPGAIITPGVVAGKFAPVTVTTVPRAPAGGLRVTVGAGGGVTVKNALAEKAPTVAVMVATPKGATPSMVTLVSGSAPAGVVMKVTGEITPGAVIIP